MLAWTLFDAGATDSADCFHFNTADTPDDYCWTETGIAKGASFATILAALNTKLTAEGRTNETQG